MHHCEMPVEVGQDCQRHLVELKLYEDTESITFDGGEEKHVSQLV